MPTPKKPGGKETKEQEIQRLAAERASAPKVGFDPKTALMKLKKTQQKLAAPQSPTQQQSTEGMSVAERVALYGGATAAKVKPVAPSKAAVPLEPPAAPPASSAAPLKPLTAPLKPLAAKAPLKPLTAAYIKEDSMLRTQGIDVIQDRVNRQINDVLKKLESVDEKLHADALDIIKNNGEPQSHLQLLTKLTDFVKSNQHVFDKAGKNGERLYAELPSSLSDLRSKVLTAFSKNIIDKPWKKLHEPREIVSDMLIKEVHEGTAISTRKEHALMLQIISNSSRIEAAYKKLTNTILKGKTTKQFNTALLEFRNALSAGTKDKKLEDDVRKNCMEMLISLDDAVSSIYPQLQFKRQEPKAKADTKPLQSVPLSEVPIPDYPVFVINITHFSDAARESMQNSLNKLKSKDYSIKPISFEETGLQFLEISGSDIEKIIAGVKEAQNIVGKGCHTHLIGREDREVDCFNIYKKATTSGINVTQVTVGEINRTDTFKANAAPKSAMTTLFQRFNQGTKAAVDPSGEEPTKTPKHRGH